MIQKPPCPRSVSAALWLILLAILPTQVPAAPPDLTGNGVIAGIDRSATYNLGPTGLRGWIYIGGEPGATIGPDGTMTDQSRQILVTVASTPASAVLQVDDVILGAMAANSGTVPYFSSDCRKAFGNAITDAEKTGAGTLRVKRWRAGTITDVNIPMTIMGDYSSTAPYSCPKSSLILANARDRLVADVLANPNYFNNYYASAIHALALLAGVQPGDPNYTAIQARLQNYARSLATEGPRRDGLDIWTWAYVGIFLSEYYLSTGDTQILPGINQFAITLSQSQSMYGTFGHNPALPRPDGSGRRSVIGYGPVNMAGLPANLAIVMAKKALVAGSQTIDPEINAAIQRGTDFFAWYTNKGSIPYGEHIPGADNHASNGKDQIAAMLFAQQDNRLAETEYFTRMSIAGYPGHEYGHTGQGFSYMWQGMAANIGGITAAAEYLKKVRWHLDLSRRTDGSFAYDGAEQYGAGSTNDGTYLGRMGSSSYSDLDPTASYILTYSLPLKRLYITGKTAPASPNSFITLDSTKVANAIAAGTYKSDRTSRTVAQLIADLSEFDPVVRNFAAQELTTRTLSTADLTTLRSMLTSSDANARMGACQTLGLLKDATAMPMLTQRLDKTVESVPWVRAMAASALTQYGNAASTQRDPMLTAFAANATDPDIIVWSDPIQASNSFLSLFLFSDAINGNPDITAHTIGAPKNLLFPAVKAALKQPDSYPRSGASSFAYNKLTLADIQAMPMDLINLIQYECQADRMWGPECRGKGISTLARCNIAETIPLAIPLLDVPANWGMGSGGYVIPALNALAYFGDAARWTLPTLRSYLTKFGPTSDEYNTLVNAIATIEAATTSPAGITYLKAYANPQVVTTNIGSAKAITLTGSSCREPSVTCTVLTQPAHGTLTGTAPNLTYTPTGGYTGPDQFTFQTADTLTTSAPATVGIVVGTAGTGLKGEYFDNANFSNLKLTRTDAQVNFDWGTGSPDASIGADTFSVRWSGQLLVPETGTYTFSTLSSDGVRLYINGVAIIDNFVDQSTRWVDGTPIQLTAGQMASIQMEYYENTGSAVAKLKWTGPSIAGEGGAIIPQAYLFNSSGGTPYANPQTVSMLQNTSQGITLTGSGGTLTYTVLTQPAHGTLTGFTPYLTYIPDSNYTGPDSFTFLVNNGAGNSSPATVTLSILSALPATFTWNIPVDGTMGNAANWTSGTAPAAAGLNYYNLDFAPAGTYTVTHDLNNGFQLNQLNVSGNVTFSGSNAFTFAANGGILPQFNQNSSNAVTINIPISLAAMTTFGGSGGGQITMNSLISGSGGLVKNSPGTWKINNSNNTYSGGTVINAGRVTFPDGNGGGLGTGPVTLNPNAILNLEVTTLPNTMLLNGGRITGGNSFASYLTGPVTLSGTTTIDLGTTGGFGITGNISGSGGIMTVGTTNWAMSGTNTYTGPTTIQAGSIYYQTAAAMGPGPINISTGGKATLNYSGNRVIASLTLGGIAMPPGSYGSTSSPATNKDNSYFAGTGTVTVLPPTTTSLSLSNGSSPANAGTPLTFTATVTGTTPTGNVSFYAGATLLGTSALNGSYQASLTTSSLAAGSHSITATYAGNASNSASTSNALAIDITTNLPATPANLLAEPNNNQARLTWSVSSGATGYRVKRSTTNGGPYTVIGNPSTASYTDLTPVNGTTYYYVVCAFNGNGDSADSSQVSATPAILPSTTTLTSSPFATGPYGTAVTFTATVSVSGAPAAGTVTLKDGTTVLGTGTLSAGQVDFTISTLAVASHSLTATYSGDINTPGSVSDPYNYVVTAKALTLTGVTATDKYYDGTSTAVLSGGTLSGVIAGETVTVVTGTGNFARTNVGKWAVTATGYSLGGSNASNYVLSAQPAVPDATIRLASPSTQTTTRTYNLGPQGGGTTINVSHGPGSMGNLIPWVTQGTLPACSVLRSVSANIRLDSSTADSGCNDFFFYVDGNPAAAGTAAYMQIGGDYSGKVGTVAQKLAWGMGGGGPGATVTATKTAGVDWSGDIDLNAFQLSLGNNYATATWSGTITIEYDVPVLAPGAPTNLLAASGNNQIGLTWTASTGATGYYVKRSLASGGPYTVIASAVTANHTDTTAVNGTAYYYVVSAFNTNGESANSNQSSSTPAPLTLASTTTLSSSPPSSGVYGTSVTFTATVAGSAGTPTGTVTFKDGDTTLGNGTLSAGTATFTTSTLPAANHSITATYGGNSTYSVSTSAASSYQVTPKSVTLGGVTAADKIYDGTTTATLSGGTLGGVISGDTVTLVAGTGAFADANVGTAKTVTATGYSLGGTHAANYVLTAQPAGLAASITARYIHISGTRAYDGTVAAPANVLTIANNVDGANLTLSGSATLAAKDVGERAITTSGTQLARVQSAKAATNNASTSLSITLSSTPANGNTLIAVISTRGIAANQVSGITGGGVTWTRVSQAFNTNGTTTEIWYGPNVTTGTTGIAITQANLRSAAVVMEYSGLLTPTSFDLAANSTGNGTTTSTGTTVTTNQANELWIGGIGIASSSPTLGSLANSFLEVDNAFSSGTGNASNNARIYALERMVTSTGAASTGGTITTAQWSGAIATFKATTSTLALSGSAAGNYTLAGATGSVTITPKALTVGGLTASNKTYDGTTAAGVTGTPALSAFEAVGSGSSTDGQPYTGDNISLSGTLTGGTFATKHVGTAKPITGVTGLTLTGSQAGNYVLAPLSSLTANVTQMAVTVAAVSATKTYDGTTSSSDTPTITPALASGDVATDLSQSYQSASAGISNKTLVPTITINDGNGGANYAVTLTNSTTGTINPKSITVAAVNATKTYDGTTTAPGTPTITPALAAGDSASVLSQSFQTATAGINNKVIIPSITLVDGNGGNNYAVTLSNFTTGTINKATATVTLGNLSQTYDGTSKTVSVTTNPTPLAYAVTYDGSASAPVGAGSYAVVATVTDANYAGSNSGSLVISKAAQTITFGALADVLDNAIPFTLGATASSGLTVSYASSNPAVATVSGNTVTVVGLGTTTITASQTGDSNYDAATSMPQNLTVGRTNPLALTSGPYKIFVGQSLSLNGGGSLPSAGATITAYDWDLNNDSIFGDATGATPAAISLSTLTGTWGMHQGINTIQLRVTDSATKTATISTTVELVLNLTWDANGTTSGQTNGAGGWLTAGKWWDGTSNQTWVAGSNAIFGGPSTAGGAVTLASPTSVNAITFNTFTGTYTLGTAGQALTINGGITMNATAGAVIISSPVILGAAQSWINNSSTLSLGAQSAGVPLDNSGNLLAIDGSGSTFLKWGVISGNGGFTKNGSGFCEIGGQYSGVTHTYTGTTTINGGVLRVNGDTGSLGNLGSGNLNLNGGVLEYYYGGTFTRSLGTGAGEVQLPGGASGFGCGNSVTFTLNNNAAYEVVWGSTYFNPSTLVLNATTSGGTTTFANKLDLNAATRTIQVNAGTARISGVIRTSTGTAGIVKTGNGILQFDAANTYNGDTTINGGILRIGNNTAGTLGNGGYNGNISIASGSTLQIWSTANQTLGGTISGAGSLNKAYGGTLTLSNTNTYTGKTFLVPQNTTGFTVSVSSFNSVNGGSPLLATSSLGAPTTEANGTIDFGSTGVQATVTLKYTGNGETTDRIINFLFNGTGVTKTLDASGAGLLKFTSTFTGSGSTTNDIALQGSSNGEIVGGLPFVFRNFSKAGTGTWTLGGTCLHTGTTTITAGKLALGASNILPNTTAVSIANATLDAATFSDTLGTLDVTSTATMNLGTGASLAFADTSAIDWTGGTLTLTGTFVSGSSLRFGTTSTGLTATQLGKISKTGVNSFGLDANGYLVALDTTPPTLAATSITDDKSGGPVTVNTLVTYTVTFSEDMDSNTIASDDFGNAGTAAATVNSVTETSPGVFTVQATPTSAGTLQLKVIAGAVLKDVAGNNLVTTAAIADNTTLTVNATFQSWSNSIFANGTLSNTNMAFDADGDGLSTGIEWVVGGDPTLASDAASKAPVSDNTDPTYFIYSYRRTDASNADPKTSIVVEYGGTPGSWTPAANDGSNIIITPSNDAHGAGVDKVEVKIKRTLVPGGKLFSRLKVVISP